MNIASSLYRRISSYGTYFVVLKIYHCSERKWCHNKNTWLDLLSARYLQNFCLKTHKILGISAAWIKVVMFSVLCYHSLNLRDCCVKASESAEVDTTKARKLSFRTHRECCYNNLNILHTATLHVCY